MHDRITYKEDIPKTFKNKQIWDNGTIMPTWLWQMTLEIGQTKTMTKQTKRLDFLPKNRLNWWPMNDGHLDAKTKDYRLCDMKDERQSWQKQDTKDKTEHLQQKTKWQKTKIKPRTENEQLQTTDKTKDLEMTKDLFASSTRLWYIPTDLTNKLGLSTMTRNLPITELCV